MRTKLRTWIPVFAGMTLLVIPAISSAAPALQSYISESGEEQKVLPQVLVKYKSGSETRGRAMMKRLGAVKTRSIGRTGVTLINVPAGKTVQSFVAELKTNDDIEFVEPNGIMRMFDTPNDTDFGSQYSLTSNFTKVQETWDLTNSVAGATVAVIDTGAILTHDDLENQFWINDTVSGNSGLHGTQIEIDWNNDSDCVDTDPDVGPEQCASPTPTDDNVGEYHGTRVAGIIAAQTNNNLNIAGVSRNARIMVIKALNADGIGDFAGIAEAIVYARENGASIINMSLGGPTSSNAVATAIADAVANNIVVVAAAGNDGAGSPVNFPASIPAVIAVGATNSSNQLASFSCTGTALDLVAPGVGIISTVGPGDNSNSGINDSGNDGTSFSAPIVSGVAALIRGLYPSMSVAKVTEYLTLTATDLGAGGTDNNFGHGLLNALLAVQSAQAGLTLVASAPAGETHLYPNPFNPLETATAGFALPRGIDEAAVEIDIFNVAGELVKTIDGTEYKAWDGKNDDGSILAPGIYFYKANTSAGNLKGKLTIRQ